MADISKISPDGGTTEYNIKDATARTDVSTINGKIPSGASSSNKMATTSDVTTVTNGVIANTKLIKDTVGWSGKNLWMIRSDVSTVEANGITYTISRTGGKVDYIDIHGTATGRAAMNATIASMGMTFKEGRIRMENLPTGVAGVNIQYMNGSQELAIGTFNSATKYLTVTSEKANKPVRIEIVVANGTTMNHAKLYPMITDENVLDQSYEPYFGSTAVDWASYAKTGVHNLFDIKSAVLTNKNSNSSEKTETGVRVYSESEGTYFRSALTINNLKLNTNYRVFFDVNYVSGEGQLDIRYGEGGDTGIYATPVITSSGKYELKFNSRSYSTLYFNLFCTKGTSAIGDVTYSNIVLCYDEDTCNDFAPYAMTNRELTEWANTKVNTDSTTGIKYYKSGNTVTVFFDDSSNVTTSEAYETIFTLPAGYRPKVQVSFKDSYSSKRVVISTSGAIQCNETLSNVALRGCITYVV